MLEDAERLIAVWNERQAKQMPMLFSPTIGAAVAAGYWFLSVRCPACRTTNAIDLRTLDRHRDAAVTSLIPALSCRSCRPNAPFAELVRLSRTSIADEMRKEHARARTGLISHAASTRYFIFLNFSLRSCETNSQPISSIFIFSLARNRFRRPRVFAENLHRLFLRDRLSVHCRSPKQQFHQKQV